MRSHFNIYPTSMGIGNWRLKTVLLLPIPHSAPAKRRATANSTQHSTLNTQRSTLNTQHSTLPSDV
ncbi:hypothetical protein [Anabaena sp. CCY 9402-a]|uniref:hypothetical protein n=1 Tax=Anabaena sp. CCY 9402-a TaxID=3103867 RepID=UPI0039C70FFA